jgi:hypothetical protein
MEAALTWIVQDGLAFLFRKLVCWHERRKNPLLVMAAGEVDSVTQQDILRTGLVGQMFSARLHVTRTGG